MSEANNEHSTSTVKLALIGNARDSAQIAGILRETPGIEMLGQAGMAQAKRVSETPWFDDTRVLLSQSGLRGVVLAGSPLRDLETASTAEEFGLAIWRRPPLARSFSEATEWIERIRRGAVVHRVASWWEHLRDHAWNDIPWAEPFKPRFSELRVCAPGPGLDGWRASTAQSAGGVLACDAYRWIEALTAIRGLPETIAAMTGRFRTAGAPEPSRQTEDTAVALFQYSGGGSAVVQANWDLPAKVERVAHHSGDRTAVLTCEEIAVYGEDGAAVERRPISEQYLDMELRGFVELVRQGARDRAAAPLELHLATTAVLDSIYLAARTGHPESPRRLYESQGWPEPRQT